MGALKWITGFLGWVSGGPIGALIGFLLGRMVESGLDAMRQLNGGDGTAGGYSGTSYQGYPGASRPGGYSATEQRNSFMVSLLVLSSAAIRINAADASSIIAMYYKDSDSAYAVLEISPSATDDEVKSAYRRMAMKNHPDKVATLGPDVQKAAEEKFRKVQEAYETIKKQRGMN